MKYIGIDEEELKAKHGYYAAYEIERQPQLWKQVYESIRSHESDIQAFFTKLHQETNLKVLLMGAGSSNLAARSVAHHAAMHTPWEIVCEPSTKVVLDPQEYFQADQPLLLVSFGSSGSTPEGVACNRLAKKMVKSLYQIMIVCVEDGILVQENAGQDNVLYIPLPKQTKGESFAATAEFTCLVLQAMLLFDYEHLSDYESLIPYFASEADRLFHENISMMHEIAASDTVSLTALGSREMEVLAAETALKAVEFTNGRYLSNYNSSVEFRHGPKLILTSPVLCLFYLHPDPYIAKYDLDMMSEVSGDENHGTIVGFGYQPLPQKITKPNFYYEFKSHPQLERCPVAGIFLYALAMQTFITLIALKKGVNADWPSSDELVPKVANRVNIYEREVL